MKVYKQLLASSQKLYVTPAAAGVVTREFVTAAKAHVSCA